MKKFFPAIIALILLITVCFSFLRIGKNDLQAVFSCLRTALDKNAIYAIENKSTNNCFIVQTDKESNTVRIYRRDENDTLIRYTLFNDNITTAVVGTDGWVHRSTYSLPYEYLTFADQCTDVINGKTEKTDVIESYINLFLASFSSVQHHSSQIVNYNTLCENIAELSDYLSDRDTKECIGWQAKTKGTKKVIRFTPFCNEDVNGKIVSSLLNCLQPEIKEQLNALQPIMLPVQSDLSVELTTDLFNTLKSFCIYRNDDCIFSVRKLK